MGLTLRLPGCEYKDGYSAAWLDPCRGYLVRKRTSKVTHRTLKSALHIVIYDQDGLVGVN